MAIHRVIGRRSVGRPPFPSSEENGQQLTDLCRVPTLWVYVCQAGTSTTGIFFCGPLLFLVSRLPASALFSTYRHAPSCIQYTHDAPVWRVCFKPFNPLPSNGALDVSFSYRDSSFQGFTSFPTCRHAPSCVQIYPPFWSIRFKKFDFPASNTALDVLFVFKIPQRHPPHLVRQAASSSTVFALFSTDRHTPSCVQCIRYAAPLHRPAAPTS